MACAAVSLGELCEERENFSCLTLLLFRVGNNTLRQHFKSRWLAVTGTPWRDSPADGNQLLTTGGLRLSNHEKPKVQSGDTIKWDFTILTQVLLRSSQGFVPPGTPENNELDKLRKMRYEICHATDARLQTADFTPNWQIACNALKLFGANQTEFDSVENDSRKPWKELFPLLQQCLDNEDILIAAVNSINDQLSNLHEDYKEINRGIKQSNEEMKRGNAEIMTTLTKLDVKLDEVCHVERPKSTETQHTSDYGRNTAQHFSSYLKQHYTSGERAVIQPFPWMDETLFELETMFTRLRVIQREKERSTETDEEVAMHEVFKSHNDCKKTRTVLFEGKPGIGKTTFCQKLVYDWAKGKIPSSSSFPEVEHVLLLKCRDIENGDIWQAIEDQLLPEEMTGENQKMPLFDYIKENQENVLLIIDGYDELPAEKYVQERLMKVINGRTLSRCHIIVTTRPEKGAQLRKHFDNLSEIKGFHYIDMCEFIEKYFQKSHLSLAKSLIDFVSGNNLLDLVSTPLNTALLCVVYEERNGRLLLKGNSTYHMHRELYQEIVFCVTKRYCVKEGKDVDDDTLMEEYHAVHMVLGKLAFDGLQCNKLYFKQSQLPPNERELVSKLGFLIKEKSASKLRSEVTFSFTHKTIQEYFAVLYVADCLTDRDPQAFCSVKTIEMVRIIHMYLVDILSTVNLSTNKIIHFIQCLTSLLPPTPEHSQLPYPSAFIFTFICELIGNLRDETEMQAAANSTCAYLRPSVEVHYGLDNTSDKVIPGLCCLLSSSSTANPNHCDSTSGFIVSEGNTVTKMAKSPLSHLKVICPDENVNDISNAMLQKFALAIRQNKRLIILNLSYVGGFSSIFDGLETNTHLTYLNISVCNIKDTDAEVLRKVFTEMKALVKLDLGCNSLGALCCLAIADGLTKNQKLSLLDVRACNIDVEGGCKIADGLNFNDNLTILNMGGNEIGDDAACAIAEALAKNKSLKELRLELNKIGVVGCEAIAHALTRNKTLILLDISNNEVGDHGTCAIANEALMNNSSLTHLNIANCRISDVGTCAVADVLASKNKTLTHLSMGWKQFAAEGFRAIIDLVIRNMTLIDLDVTWLNDKLCDSTTLAFADAVSRNMTLAYIAIGKTCGTTTLTQDPRVQLPSDLDFLCYQQHKISKPTLQRAFHS